MKTTPKNLVVVVAKKKKQGCNPASLYMAHDNNSHATQTDNQFFIQSI
jgi:hypothetical protein